MEFDDEIRRKIKSDLPKLTLFDGKEYQKLLEAFHQSDKNGKVFFESLGITISWEDATEFIQHQKMSKLMMAFFANYLQNENLLKGEEASMKVFFGLSEIKVYDANGNLEYDTMPSIQNQITLPNYVAEVFDEIVLFVFDLQRWMSLYLNKERKVGQLFDFKNEKKVDVYQTLEVLNELVKEEYKLQIVDYDIRVLVDNVNYDTDGAYFFMNLLYKLIQGVSLDKLKFNPKENLVLDQRLAWLILKVRELYLSQSKKKGKSTTKASKNKNMDEDGGNSQSASNSDIAQNDEEDDIILDDEVHRKAIANQNRTNKSHNTYHKANLSNNNLSSSIRVDNESNDDLQQDDDKMPTLRSIRQNDKRKTTQRAGGRNTTKLLSLKPMNVNSSSRLDLQESFDVRNQSNSFMQPQAARKVAPSTNKKLSYQESANEELDSMWNFGNETGPAKPSKPVDEVDEYLGKMWNFKTQFKKGAKQGHNMPMLIPEDQKELYRERANQNSVQRSLQDKVIDILVSMEDPNQQEAFNNPALQFAMERLKERLGVESDSGQQGDQIKTKDFKELKSVLKEKLMEGVTGGLDQILERQKILDDILEYDTEDKAYLEKRFEGEIQKIDQRFQTYMQKYDALNQFQGLQAMYNNTYWGPPVEEITQMKGQMHSELQNYLLSGMGLPSKFSNNPTFQNKPQPPAFLKDPISSPTFNQSSVFPMNTQSPLPTSGKMNNSGTNFNHKATKSQPKLMNRQQQTNKDTQSIPPDVIALRYNVAIKQKDLIDILTVDRVNEKVLRFLLAYLEERYLQTLNRDEATRIENRVLIYPAEFYTALSFNNPSIPQVSLNHQAVQKYTNKYYGSHTIFHEYDRLIFPIFFGSQQYSLAVADLNVQQLLVFYIIQKPKKKDDNPLLYDFPKDSSKNPVGLNILRYLEKEFNEKTMKKLPILNWSIEYVPCAQTQIPELSVYYLLLYIGMTLDQRFKYKYATNDQIKGIKLWIPQVFKSVGVTLNNPGELHTFIDPP